MEVTAFISRESASWDPVVTEMIEDSAFSQTARGPDPGLGGSQTKGFVSGVLGPEAAPRAEFPFLTIAAD